MPIAKALYTILPVENLERSKHYWTSLGFPINENFTDYRFACIELRKDANYIFLSTKKYYNEIHDGNEALYAHNTSSNAIQLNNKKEIIELISKAESLGAERILDPVDLGWLYYETIKDIDGNIWQFLYVDDQVI